MKHNLSFPIIAATLAALDATGLAACGGSQTPSESPVKAQEVPPASSAEKADEPEPAASPGEADQAASAGDQNQPATDATDAGTAPKKMPMKNMKTGGGKASCGAGTCGSSK